MKEGGGENDEEKAYGEDLEGDGDAVSWVARVGEKSGRMQRGKGKHTKDNAMIVLRPAAILSVCRVHWLGPGLC